MNISRSCLWCANGSLTAFSKVLVVIGDLHPDLRTCSMSACIQDLRRKRGEVSAATHDAVTTREGLRRRAKVEKVATDVDPARLVVVRIKVAAEPARGPPCSRFGVRLTWRVLRFRDRLVVDVTSRRESLACREGDTGVADGVRRAAIGSALREGRSGVSGEKTRTERCKAENLRRLDCTSETGSPTVWRTNWSSRYS